MKYLVIFLAIFIVTNSYANTGECDPQVTLDSLYAKTINDAAEIASRTIPLLKKLEKFVGGVEFKDGKNLMESMNNEQVAEYTKIQLRVWTQQMAQIVTSRRERDLIVIMEMMGIMEGVYEGRSVPQINPDDFVKFTEGKMFDDISKGKQALPYVEILTLFVFAANRGGELHMKERKHLEDQCGAIGSINKKISTIVGRFDDINIETTNKFKQFRLDMFEKYKIESLTFDKFNSDEKSLLAHYKQVVIDPSRKILGLVNDYKLIKVLLKTNNDIYESDIHDVYLHSGDNEMLGTTLEKRLNDGLYDGTETEVISAWRILNRTVPTPMAMDAEKNDID